MFCRRIVKYCLSWVWTEVSASGTTSKMAVLSLVNNSGKHMISWKVSKSVKGFTVSYLKSMVSLFFMSRFTTSLNIRGSSFNSSASLSFIVVSSFFFSDFCSSSYESRFYWVYSIACLLASFMMFCFFLYFFPSFPSYSFYLKITTPSGDCSNRVYTLRY